MSHYGPYLVTLLHEYLYLSAIWVIVKKIYYKDNEIGQYRHHCWFIGYRSCEGLFDLSNRKTIFSLDCDTFCICFYSDYETWHDNLCAFNSTTAN